MLLHAPSVAHSTHFMLPCIGNVYSGGRDSGLDSSAGGSMLLHIRREGQVPSGNCRGALASGRHFTKTGHVSPSRLPSSSLRGGEAPEEKQLAFLLCPEMLKLGFASSFAFWRCLFPSD